MFLLFAHLVLLLSLLSSSGALYMTHFSLFTPDLSSLRTSEAFGTFSISGILKFCDIVCHVAFYFITIIKSADHLSSQRTVFVSLLLFPLMLCLVTLLTQKLELLGQCSCVDP